MDVAIRVDASAAIGGGHLQRCLALAQALRDGGAALRFVVRDLGLDTRSRIEAGGFDALVLPPPGPADAPDGDVPHAAWAGVASHTDAEQTCAALGAAAGPPPQCLVVDHYAFDLRWHRAVRAALGCDIAVVDDLADRSLDGRWLVDHNPHRDHRAKYGPRWAVTGALLGGPAYALLGPAFAGAPKHEVADSVRSIGIFVGSSDAAGLSTLALKACREVAHFDGPIEIVTTRASPGREALASAVATTPNTHLLEDLPDLSNFFARHDLQIGAGGGATWERCCIGAPSLLLTAAANQNVVVPELDALGVAVGLPAASSTADIGAAVRRLIDAPASARREMSRRAQALVDGVGARRVALCLLTSELGLRPLTPDDAEVTHRWRNDERTRAVTRDPRPIDPQSHRQWLARALQDPRRALWMARVGRVDVGVIRFDDHATGHDCEVSLYLDPALQGLGLGSAMLRAGERARRSRTPAAARFTATVLLRNPTSRRMFERAGYVFDGELGAKPFDDAAASTRKTAA
jgi:UDP-2,4-diacetamido-2,4,6-trideoxy-beta-L-altropyranose hydrolase